MEEQARLDLEATLAQARPERDPAKLAAAEFAAEIDTQVMLENLRLDLDAFTVACETARFKALAALESLEARRESLIARGTRLSDQTYSFFKARNAPLAYGGLNAVVREAVQAANLALPTVRLDPSSRTDLETTARPRLLEAGLTLDEVAKLFTTR
jgi:hypothetical protein